MGTLASGPTCPSQERTCSAATRLRCSPAIRRRAPRTGRRVAAQTAHTLADGRRGALPVLACSYPEGWALELCLSTPSHPHACCWLKGKLSLHFNQQQPKRQVIMKEAAMGGSW